MVDVLVVVQNLDIVHGVVASQVCSANTELTQSLDATACQCSPSRWSKHLFVPHR